MRLIEKVVISKFRSLGESEIIETFDLNIFSGSNDSGKSNILKALNLFFNGQTDLNIRYNSESDFNKWFRDNNIRGQRIIEISVYITKGNYGDKKDINNGFIAKKTFRDDGGFDLLFYKTNGEEIKQKNISHRKANAVINEKIRFIYIPAIRDLKFRESIQRQIQEIANSTDNRFKSQALKEAFVNMGVGIDNQLADLTKRVKENMNIDVETNVNFGTLLESLSFETSEKIKIKKRRKGDLETQKINLQNRGEGIQMQFFSFLLWFISKNDKKHFYIWGYEEPEVAFEFKRQFELAEVFQDTFSKIAQIFITTHSPAFAFSESNDITKVFRVNYEKERKPQSIRYISKVKPIEEYYEGLFKELTTVSIENKKSLERDIWGINAQKISKMIGESMDEIIGLRQISNNQLEELKHLIASQQIENNNLKNRISTIEHELKELFPDKVFICEDENAIKLWEKLFFEKTGIINDKLKVISSKGCTNNEVEIALMHLMKEKNGYNPIVFRQLDRDGFSNEQIVFLEMAKARNADFQKFRKYKVSFLPVNEIENFSIQTDSYYTEDKLKVYEINNKITDAFRQTINNNLINAQKLCKSDTERDLFRGQESKMLLEARTNLLKYFPGKEIKRIKTNFNCDNALLKNDFNSLPLELQGFLNDIKIFFDTI
jgi:predicted ATPase